MLDMSLRAEDEGERRLTYPEMLDVLRRQAVKPREPIKPRHRDHAAIRAIDDPLALREPALLTVRIAEVPGNPRVGRVIRRWNGTACAQAH